MDGAVIHEEEPEGTLERFGLRQNTGMNSVLDTLDLGYMKYLEGIGWFLFLSRFILLSGQVMMVCFLDFLFSVFFLKNWGRGAKLLCWYSAVQRSESAGVYLYADTPSLPLVTPPKITLQAPGRSLHTSTSLISVLLKAVCMSFPFSPESSYGAHAHIHSPVSASVSSLQICSSVPLTMEKLLHTRSFHYWIISFSRTRFCPFVFVLLRCNTKPSRW